MSGNAREAGRTTIDRVLSLIDVLDYGELSLTEIATRARLPLTTASRILSALETWGGVERDADGGYRVGVRLWEVGARATSAAVLREAALWPMQELYESTRATVQLAVRDHHSALVIEQLSTPRTAPVTSRVGRRLPLHASAAGKVLLAAAGPRALSDLCAGGLRRHTPYTQIMPGKLAASLTMVRDRGIAYAREELTLGTASAAAPITDPANIVRAALGIVVSSFVDVTRLAAAVREAAEQASCRLAELDRQAPRRATDAIPYVLT